MSGDVKKRNDGEAARRWRGPLFNEFDPTLPPWRGKGGVYTMLEPPRSVTFPICAWCNHVIWSWPHYEEEITEKVICDECAEEDRASQ